MSKPVAAVVDPYAGLQAHKRLMKASRDLAVRDTGIMSSRKYDMALRNQKTWEKAFDRFIAKKAVEKKIEEEHVWTAGKVSVIKKTVCKHYGVSLLDIVSARRHLKIVMPRMIAMYLCRHFTTLSLPQIGHHFGDRDHSTVLHAVRKIDKLRSNDSALDEEIRVIEGLLREQGLSDE